MVFHFLLASLCLNKPTLGPFFIKSIIKFWALEAVAKMEYTFGVLNCRRQSWSAAFPSYPFWAFGSENLRCLILASFVFKVPSPIASRMPWDSDVDGMQIIGRIGPAVGCVGCWGRRKGERGDVEFCLQPLFSRGGKLPRCLIRRAVLE